MKITEVEATWLRYPIPEAGQHTSDFGRLRTLGLTLVRVATDAQHWQKKHQAARRTISRFIPLQPAAKDYVRLARFNGRPAFKALIAPPGQ